MHSILDPVDHTPLSLPLVIDYFYWLVSFSSLGMSKCKSCSTYCRPAARIGKLSLTVIAYYSRSTIQNGSISPSSQTPSSVSFPTYGNDNDVLIAGAGTELFMSAGQSSKVRAPSKTRKRERNQLSKASQVFVAIR